MDNIEHTNNIDVNTSLSKQLMYIAFASIISADNDKLDEDTKQAIIAKYEAETKMSHLCWIGIRSQIQLKMMSYETNIQNC